MHLIEKKGLEYELKIDTLDDLWILSQFIVPNDTIFSTTIRKVKIGNENSTKQVQKVIFVELKVKKTNFEHETLKISGEIQNETEFTAIGQSHTLNFNLNDKIKIKKNSLLKYEQKLLKSSLDSKKSFNLLVLLDRDELLTCEFSEFSYRVLFEKKGLGSKKYHLQNINENEEKFKLLEDLFKKDYSNIIFAGPGNYKENLKKYINDKTGLKILSFSYPDISSHIIPKLIKEVSKSGILQESQIGREEEFISKLLENINKDEKSTYGYKNVEEAISQGKIEALLISTKFINKKKEDNEYQDLSNLMNMTEQINGELVIINSKNQPGKILDGITGIAGILRY